MLLALAERLIGFPPHASEGASELPFCLISFIRPDMLAFFLLGVFCFVLPNKNSSERRIRRYRGCSSWLLGAV